SAPAAEGERGPRKRRRRRKGKPVDGAAAPAAADQANPSAVPAIRQSAPSNRGGAQAQPTDAGKRGPLLGGVGSKRRTRVAGSPWAPAREPTEFHPYPRSWPPGPRLRASGATIPATVAATVASPCAPPHNRGMTVLRFENVSKQYPGGHQALVDVSFAVDEGEMLFVTGHSGAGKSTLLKLIHLSARPSRGAVLLGDRHLQRVRGGRVALHRRQVGAVYQDPRLLTDRTVCENVALPLILRGTRRAEIGKRVRSVLERMGLGHREKALPTQLSAGEQQRVGIARAIIAEPPLLVADEPTG